MSLREIDFTVDGGLYRLSIWDHIVFIGVDRLSPYSSAAFCNRYVLKGKISAQEINGNREDEICLPDNVVDQVNRILKLRLFL